MSAPFKVGEIAVGQNFIFWPELNGVECEVIAGLEFREGGCPRSGRIKREMTYVVQWANGFVSQAGQNRLRRRRPPATDSHERTFMADIRKLADKAPQRVKESV